MKPHIILKAATSLDGYLDDGSPERRVFSSAQDLEAVDELRSSVDAIFIGAETVRKDNPQLTVKSELLIKKRIAAGRPPQPARVTITASGNLSSEARFFSENGGRAIVYTAKENPGLTQGEWIGIEKNNLNLGFVIGDMAAKGLSRVLIEGGSRIISEVLDLGLADEFRLSTAAFFICNDKAPRLLPTATWLKLNHAEKLGANTVLNYSIQK